MPLMMTYLKSLASMIMGWSLGLFISGDIMAADRCPQPFPPKSPVAITSYLPSMTSTSSSRASNTSGCERGTPSEKFYKPLGVVFLLKNQDHVAEEAAQGEGPHLEALVQLAGCQQSPVFLQVIQQNYPILFEPLRNQKRDAISFLIWQRIITLTHQHPELSKYCSVVY